MRTQYCTLSHTIQTLDQEHWHRVLDGFHDASIFQTIPFFTAMSPSSSLEHFLLRRGSEVVAAAQIRLIRVPLLGSCIAYVPRAPLWQRQNGDHDLNVLQEAIRLLRQEYAVNRGIALRISPQFADGAGPDYVPHFLAEGYARAASKPRPRTILVRLDRSLDQLRKGLDQKWRNCLNQAEKNDLTLVAGSDDAMFDLFLPMYRQMLARKRLAEPGNIRAFMAIQGMLPAHHKMKVILGLSNGQPSAGAICSAIGRRGVYLFGATADTGLRNKAAYAVQWRVIEWLKSISCTEYDLHGVNSKVNPGVYSFKVGLSGKNGQEVESPGDFDAYRGLRGKLLLQLADVFKAQRDRIRSTLGKYASP